MQLGGHSGHPARQDLADFAGELAEQFRIGVDDLFGRDIMPTARHFAVRLAEGDTTFYGFRLGHGRG